MTLHELTLFFQWCFVFSMAFYAITVVFSIFARDFMFNVHKKMFNIQRESFDIIIYSYVGLFKILITVFIFVPWLALLMLG